MPSSETLILQVGPGLVFQLEHLPQDLYRRIESYVGYFARRESLPLETPLRIDLEPPPKRVSISEPPLLTEPPLVVRRAQAVTLFELPTVLAWCDPIQGRGGISFRAPSNSDLDDFTHLALAPMLMELAVARDWIGLHSAALSIGGKGILLPGPSGAGKSTIFKTAYHAGFGVLSDDLVWLRETEDGARIQAFPRRFRQDRVPLPTADDVALRAIVCPAIVDQADTRLVPLALSEVLRVVVDQGGFLSGGPLSGRRFRALVRVAGRVPGFRLEAGRDREAVVPALGRVATTLD